ncbi:hypothetical protein HQ584_09875 [Patescibacteria group bacterium]|nr:hypothetical protein [Patescibacteria group bacterium]
MRTISLFFLVAVLILGVGTTFSYGFDKDIYEDSAAIKDLENLGLLMNLVQAGEATFKTSTVVFQDSQKEITDRVETEHAIIYAYKNIEIPEFLTSNFDRIFGMVANYLNIKAKDEKLVVWVVDFDTLQESYPGQKGYPGGSPNTVAALYAPHFNYFFFTSRYINDYYVAHELVHHFIDEYQEEVISGLPQVITQRNTTNLSPANFVSQHEEEIAIELPQIIIRKSLASFALRGV